MQVAIRIGNVNAYGHDIGWVKGCARLEDRRR
jgi:hypothetical protein